MVWLFGQMERHPTEEALMDGLVGAVGALDPDIILGWEVQQGSLGYLVDRAALSDRSLLQQLSRTPKVLCRTCQSLDYVSSCMPFPTFRCLSSLCCMSVVSVWHMNMFCLNLQHQ